MESKWMIQKKGCSKIVIGSKGHLDGLKQFDATDDDDFRVIFAVFQFMLKCRNEKRLDVPADLVK